MLSWLVGARSDEKNHAFVADIAARLARRVQFTTDGWTAYLTGIRRAFKFATVDFAQIIKTYGPTEDKGQARKYGPLECAGIRKARRIGRPRYGPGVNLLCGGPDLTIRGPDWPGDGGRAGGSVWAVENILFLTDPRNVSVK